MNDSTPRLLGTGFAVPTTVRTNDDPVFDWLKANNPAGMALFTGYDERRVLAPGEDLMTIMLPAAQSALQNAGITVADVDLLLGSGSVSEYESPNELVRLAALLGVRADCWTVPMHNPFTNFNAALVFADSMIRAGRACHVLICIGGNWTRHVDYHTPQAISAADGAGAAVVGLGGTGAHYELVDFATLNDFSYYGSMYMSGTPIEVTGQPPLWTNPVFQITQSGIEGFKTFGETQPPLAALNLMKKHGVTGAEMAMVSHQASSVLLEQWQAALNPAEYFNTIAEFANLALANVALNLACGLQRQEITMNWLLLLGIGPDMHASAVLLRRAGGGQGV